MKKLIYMVLSLALCSCGQKGSGENASDNKIDENVATASAAPTFDADSAYQYVATQVAFGPRVPNTKAHVQCGDYLVAQLKSFGAKIYEQTMQLKTYDKKTLDCRNIIGVFNPENTNRILLCAHWDSRPYADHDANKDNYRKPIDAADDGGSGVGVLLEIARQIGKNNPSVGVDIIFFDAEDYGTPAFEKEDDTNSWCLGTQFWAKNPHVKGYRAQYGILLDMVGGHNATFYKEMQSVKFAARYVEAVWEKARDLGYGRFFLNADGGAITDDHQYVNTERNIPCIDIINYDPQSENGFAPWWHTINDTMSNIDKETLKAVGQTVLEMIYEK